jgi:hypothetical protein
MMACKKTKETAHQTRKKIRKGVLATTSVAFLCATGSQVIVGDILIISSVYVMLENTAVAFGKHPCI